MAEPAANAFQLEQRMGLERQHSPSSASIPIYPIYPITALPWQGEQAETMRTWDFSIPSG